MFGYNSKHVWQYCGRLLLVVGAGAWLYSGVLAGLVADWANDDNYSHGFLIVPLALYFAWERRRRLRLAAVRARRHVGLACRGRQPRPCWSWGSSAPSSSSPASRSSA